LLPVPLRNVALTAMELATIGRLFPGQLTAGVGHGVLEWMAQVGGRVESPMTLLREYTEALYALLHGDTVTARGRYVHLDGVTLDWPPVVVLTGGLTPDDIQTALGHFYLHRAAGRPAQVVAFVNVPADSPAAAIAATVGAYDLAGATHIAVNAVGRDVDLERFVKFTAREVAALIP
jgi:alkanesulfonate monooxygenase SsuD/methylene tetrahydromethanopterin reductase-like flavin-dependent oxidoreductase (luciferase family)